MGKRKGGQRVLGAAQGSSHLPLGHKVVHTGFRQQSLLPTFLEQEVCEVTAVRKKDDESTGHRAGIPEGQELWVSASYPPSFRMKTFRVPEEGERGEGLRHSAATRLLPPAPAKGSEKETVP